MKDRLKKILAAVDGSTESIRALEAAIDLAVAFRAKVCILEIVDQYAPLPEYYAGAPLGPRRLPWVKEQEFARLHPSVGRANLEWERRVELGHPAERICYVAEEGFDLIVMGSRGLSKVGRFLLGSVSDRVVHHAPCSVLVVRE